MLREAYGVRLRKYAHERIIVAEDEEVARRRYSTEDSGGVPPLRTIINSTAALGNVMHLRRTSGQRAVVCHKSNEEALLEAENLQTAAKTIVYSLERVDKSAMDAVRACRAPLCLGGVAPLCVAVTDKSPVWFWQPQWHANAYPCHDPACRKTSLVASHITCASCRAVAYCSAQCWRKDRPRHQEASGECAVRAAVLYSEDRRALKYFPGHRFGNVTFRSQS